MNGGRVYIHLAKVKNGGDDHDFVIVLHPGGIFPLVTGGCANELHHPVEQPLCHDDLEYKSNRDVFWNVLGIAFDGVFVTLEAMGDFQLPMLPIVMEVVKTRELHFGILRFEVGFNKTLMESINVCDITGYNCIDSPKVVIEPLTQC